MLSTLTRAHRALALFLGSSATRRISAAISRTAPFGLLRATAGQHSKFALFETLENRQLMSATYYVSPSGNDSSSGSISAPWKSIAKVSGTHLGAGDKVLFQGGATFGGTLHLFSVGGSAGNPIVIGSYGSGRATLSSGGSNGIWILGSSGVSVQNLVIKGTTGDINAQDGVRIENYSRSAKSGFSVTGCDISGYGQAGIEVVADGSGDNISNVTLSGNNLYSNVVAGIQTYSVATWGISNITISNNLTHDNQGSNSTSVTGSGISVGGVNGAMVEHNSSYNNGAKGNGAVGIWAYSSNAVTFQYNQSYGNHAAKIDGDGYDFDADTSNSVMQYNLAYDNDGGGFLLDQWKNNASFTGNIVRFNVAEDDCRKMNYGEMEAWGRVSNSSFYNNVIYSTANNSHSNVAIRIHNSSIPGLYSTNVHVANNIIETTGGEDLILIPGGETQGMKNVTLTGNVYYSNGGATNIVIGGKDYTSLSALQASGQEKFNGTSVGMIANPLFKAPGSEVPTTGTFSVASMSAFFLQSSTPIRNAGVNLSSLLGVAVPSVSTAKTIPGIDQSLIGGNPLATIADPVVVAPPVTTTTTTTTVTTPTTTTTTPPNTTTTSTAMALNIDVFNDANKSGTQTTGELGLRGWTAYIDSNNNGKLDKGESYKSTDANGTFSFTALKAGTYTVRVVAESGYTTTTAAFSTVTIAPGKSATVTIGEHKN